MKWLPVLIPTLVGNVASVPVVTREMGSTAKNRPFATLTMVDVLRLPLVQKIMDNLNVLVRRGTQETVLVPMVVRSPEVSVI